MQSYNHLDHSEGKTPYEVEVINYQHVPYYSKEHPFYEDYIAEFKKIDYQSEKNAWKNAYYEHFFGISFDKNRDEYNNYRTLICGKYLESLMWTLRYYLVGIPDWRWYYPFRVAPFASDIYFNLKQIDPNTFRFSKSKPYHPFEQLLIVLPPQNSNMLPKSYAKLMNDITSPVIEYYPIDFELDVVEGGKHIYSEPLLPEIDDEYLLSFIENIKLTADEKKKNAFIAPDVFMPKK